MRILISVGCDTYSHLDSLNAAENDASQLFERLVTPQVGGYDAHRSVLLLSPTVSEVREAIDRALFVSEPIDTFTFFFAGHGSVKSGSFYICLRESRRDALSISAISISDILRNIAEVKPSQANIILDTCQGGGLVADLNALLKQEVMGDAGTPGVTILATAAQNEFASETDSGGAGTRLLLDCIDGTLFVQDASPALDLVEIGRKIAVLREEYNQTPVVWGLNLYGPPRFCKNPHFSTSSFDFQTALRSWPNSEPSNEALSSLWRIYGTLDREFSSIDFLQTAYPMIDSLAANAAGTTVILRRLDSAFIARAAYSNDEFQTVRVSAAIACCMTANESFLNDAAISASYFKLLSTRIDQGIASVLTALSEDEFALLGGRGIADLYSLPIRLSELLGWAAASIIINLILGIDPARSKMQFTALLNHVLQQYCGSVVAMSDKQCAALAITLVVTNEIGLKDQGEVIASCMFNDLISRRGLIADSRLPHERVLRYLLQRSGDKPIDYDLVAVPSEMVLLVLACAPLFKLENVFDDCLWYLDHLSMGTFVPDRASEYLKVHMEKGINRTYKVGLDVFKVSDVSAVLTEWPGTASDSNTLLLGAIIASLVFADRVPWFLFQRSWRVS